MRFSLSQWFFPPLLSIFLHILYISVLLCLVWPSGGVWCVCTRLGLQECQHAAFCEGQRSPHPQEIRPPRTPGEEEGQEGWRLCSFEGDLKFNKAAMWPPPPLPSYPWLNPKQNTFSPHQIRALPDKRNEGSHFWLEDKCAPAIL